MIRLQQLVFLGSLALFTIPQITRAGDSCATQTYAPPKNYFVVAIDRSGSMAGDPIQATKQGALNFIANLKKGDQCALIAFSDRVEVLTGMTDDKRLLSDQVRSITAEGTTALYDAIAKSVSLLSGIDGAAVIVYLTDGVDTGSKFRLSDLESMNIVEGVLVYGLGYGSVEREKLTALSRVTGGDFAYSETTVGLTDLYGSILRRYYQSYGKNLTDLSQLSVRSLPAQLPVKVDGIEAGRTPLKIEDLEPGKHLVTVAFPKGGAWECSFDAKPSHHIVVDARESDLGSDLRIASNPKQASVFIDGNYVGITSKAPVATVKRRFRKDEKIYSRELMMPYLLPGRHQMRIIAMPDINFGGSQVFDFEFSMGSIDREVDIDIFNRISTFSDREVIRGDKADPFEELDKLLKND